MRQSLDDFAKSMLLDNAPQAVPEDIKPIGTIIEEQSKRILDNAMKEDPLQKVEPDPEPTPEPAPEPEDAAIEPIDNNIEEEREVN